MNGSPYPDEAGAALRLPPHNLYAEQSVLGGLMLDPAAWEKIDGALTAEDFYRREHRTIWAAVSRLADDDRAIDALTVCAALGDRIEDAGGRAYLAALANDTPSAANIAAYARLVRQASLRRAEIASLTRSLDAAYSTTGEDAETLLEAAQADLAAISQRADSGRGGFVGIKASLTAAVELIDERFQRDSALVGPSTGFADLDRITMGLEPGTLTILAARPSMGKTTLGMNIAAHVAESAPVAVFSLEMPHVALSMRLQSALGSIPHDLLRSGRLEDEHWPRLTSAVNLATRLDLHIDDQPGLTAPQIATRTRRLKRERGGLGLVLIDYLQLMGTARRGENRNLEVGEMTRALKGLAKTLECPVICVSQLNRSLEQRANKRPIMADLRDSGSIEQDADLIVFVYRDEVYNPESKDKGVAEAIVAKNRNGEIGTVRLAFDGRYCRFGDLARGYDEE